MQLQPYLENNLVRLTPLKETDFDILFQAAADPLIWEQHPNPLRYQRAVFETYFSGAIASKGAFLITDATTNEVIGSSRFYNYDESTQSVIIGYTFLTRKYWGGLFNPSIKHLMLEYAFQFVQRVYFHVGSQNIRSQKAMEKLGAKKMDQTAIAYYGEQATMNHIYEITKTNWLGLK